MGGKYYNMQNDDNLDTMRADFVETFNKWETTDSIIKPAHIIILNLLHYYKEVNDTPLPGLTIFAERFQLSVDWKKMLTRLYGEKAYVCRFAIRNYPQWWEWDKQYRSGGMNLLFGFDSIRIARKVRVSRLLEEIGVKCQGDYHPSSERRQNLEEQRLDILKSKGTGNCMLDAGKCTI